jgi:hypothetical protein
MAEKKDHNNPRRMFKEQDDLVVSREKEPVGPDKLLSIRRSEVTSIAPDDIKWDNIYAGKTGGLHSIKSETGFPPRKAP